MVVDVPGTHLRFLEHRLIKMGRRTYAWVDVKHFEVDPLADSGAVLEALIAHGQYEDDYAGSGPRTATDIHGKYLLSDIGVGSFDRVRPSDVRAVIRAWADRVHGPQGCPGIAPLRVRRRLRGDVYPLLRKGEVWRFAGAVEHEWGFVVGSLEGFHEFVVLDRRRGRVSLIVASDD